MRGRGLGSEDKRVSPRGFAALLGTFAVLVITVGWLGDRSRAERHLIDKLRDQNPSTPAVAAFQLSQERHPYPK